MRNLLFFLSIFSLGNMSDSAHAQDVRSILETSQEKQLQRWEGVDAYILDQEVVGQRIQTHFQRTEIVDSDGNSQTLFLPVRDPGAQAGMCGSRTLTGDELEIFAQSLELTGSVVGPKQMERYGQAGIPAGAVKGDPSEPWASPDPRIMLGAGAEFMRGAAEAQRAEAAYTPEVQAQERTDQITQFIQKAKLIGTESVDGRRAFHLHADGIDEVYESDGNEFRTEAMSMWVDASEYVPLRIKIDGTTTSGKESKPMSIEILHQDYRKVPGSNMYESHKQTTKISGMLSDAEQKELSEAQEQLAEFEEQLASMPPSQRAMMESMVGPQMEQFKQMASGGGFQTEIITHAITVNPPAAGPDGQACNEQSAALLPKEDDPSASLEDWETRLLAMIQGDLQKLGYTPGNTDGVMDKPTIVAISRFQVDNDLEVTGEPSPQLAGIIGAKANPEPEQ
jgi:hypothetical protein